MYCMHMYSCVLTARGQNRQSEIEQVIKCTRVIFLLNLGPYYILRLKLWLQIRFACYPKILSTWLLIYKLHTDRTITRPISIMANLSLQDIISIAFVRSWRNAAYKHMKLIQLITIVYRACIQWNCYQLIFVMSCVSWCLLLVLSESTQWS